jgi:pimeloyl-ACP methyl ester carboxylesterase
VVLIHGMPSSSYLWHEVIDALARTFDVIALDLLGYGDSDKRVDSDLSLASQARYVVAALEALQVYQAAFVGHDIGGGIAQLIAVDEPSRVARLVLIDSAAENNWPIAEVAQMKDPAWDQRMAGLELRTTMRKLLEAGLVSTPVTDEMVDEFVRPFNDQDGRRAYLRAARALNARDLVSRSRHIRDIATRTLILWGAQDRFIDPRWAGELENRLTLASVQRQVIDPGGHFLPLDRAEAVARALTDFLSSQ